MIRFHIAPIARVEKPDVDFGKRIAVRLWTMLELKRMHICMVFATKGEVRKTKEYAGLFHIGGYYSVWSLRVAL
jgi:hypothetical protein